MDIILENKSVMQGALQVWKEKVVPAVLEYGDQSSGKTSTLFVQRVILKVCSAHAQYLCVIYPGLCIVHALCLC